MQDAGLEVQIDRMANVRGKVQSANPNKPALLTGSHYDTVKDAGKYDGMLGIIVPIASIKTLILDVSHAAFSCLMVLVKQPRASEGTSP